MALACELAAVRQRADFRCEYCHAPEEVLGYALHVEHIVPRSKGGKDALSNYALACMPCNRAKSDHVSGVDAVTGKSSRLFNPRRDSWRTHFEITNRFEIHGKTAIGRATEARLRLNHARQLAARRIWAELGYFP